MTIEQDLAAFQSDFDARLASVEARLVALEQPNAPMEEAAEAARTGEPAPEPKPRTRRGPLTHG